MKKLMIGVYISLIVLLIGACTLRAEPSKPLDLPPPPATPTRAENQDQLDKEQQERQNGPTQLIPTQTPYAGQVLQGPPPENPETAAHPELLATVVALSPSAIWATYKNENLDFSFDYPSNWIISEPGGKFIPTNSVYELAIENFDPSKFTKGVNDLLRIDIMIIQKPTTYQSLDEWLRAGFHPETKFDEIKPMIIKNSEMRQWIVKGPTLSSVTGIVAQEVGEKIYLISYLPKESKYTNTVEKILASFTLP